MIQHDDLGRAIRSREVRAMSLPVLALLEARSCGHRLVDSDGSEVVVEMPLDDVVSARDFYGRQRGCRVRVGLIAGA